MHQFLEDCHAHLDLNHEFKPGNSGHSHSQTHKSLYDNISIGVKHVGVIIGSWGRFKYKKFIKWLLMLTFFTVNKHRPDDQNPTHLTYAGNECFIKPFISLL